MVIQEVLAPQLKRNIPAFLHLLSVRFSYFSATPAHQHSEQISSGAATPVHQLAPQLKRNFPTSLHLLIVRFSYFAATPVHQHS